ncbi:hypothetical protein ITP53_11280 [Nonomuraea sp. K274]|uniref:Phage tail protein n=1 Tax=Nonomuraea cypriaca TaxID=1187855 RepID=A0A931EXK0_9ACTN|nr:hypothetical protein [Nonomuraea cypriaca]MBF8186320.1 hypothetical protein [Nonomuraea cypriaca]
MAQRRINARDIIMEIENEAPEAWLRVERLTSVTVNPGENEETAETTDFESGGSYEQEIMQRGASMELEGLMLKDDLTGALPPGRARVEAMAGEDAVGSDSLTRVRFRHPIDPNWKIWTCTVTLGEQGGGNNDKTSWSATITKSGKSETEPVETEGAGA